MFSASYSEAYDLVYSDKDYPTECDLVEEVFREFGTGRVRKVLDLGCGTGNHSIVLAERGYEVWGVDRSEHMLLQAQEKAAGCAGGERPVFQVGDMQAIRLKEQFDAVTIMFAALGYQNQNEEVLATLETAHYHLRERGLLVFDVWYGPAVLRQRPTEKVKLVTRGRKKILRMSSGQLDLRRHICAVTSRMWEFDHETLKNEALETHNMRFFFPMELDLFFQVSGFMPLRLAAFGHLARDPDETSWNVLAVARKAASVRRAD